MKKTTKLWMALPVAAVALALGGCGGGGGSDATTVGSTTTTTPNTPGDSDTTTVGDTTTTTQPSSSPSINACFTATSTVRYAELVTYPSGSPSQTNQVTVGPMTYNGQTVTGQIITYPSGTTDGNGNPLNRTGVYWTVTSSGVTFIAYFVNDTIAPDSTAYPYNMSPGQTASGTTFVGFEPITLAGKTFTNTCHFHGGTDIAGDTEDDWYAPGYGVIKTVYSDDGQTNQYNGDL